MLQPLILMVQSCFYKKINISSEPANIIILYSFFAASEHPQLQLELVHTPSGLYAGQYCIHAVAIKSAPSRKRIIPPKMVGSSMIMLTKNDMPISVLMKLSALPIFFCI